MPSRKDRRSKPANDFIAHEILPTPDMPVTPATWARPWMDQSQQRFAYRCLPLVIANQAGWTIACPRRFSARWNGGHQPKDVRLHFGREKADNRIMSHFGEGVVTFWLPYLFRTPPGFNLWVKGPSNWVKDGVQPLEGIVEADWATSSFTMNWKITRTNHAVRFEVGEPICMIVPVARGATESLNPKLRAIEADPKLAAAYREWCKSRASFLDALDRLDPEVTQRGWEKDYMQGRTRSGETFDEHQTRLRLKPFERE
jgi:hypothetical protein